ncbi:MAG: hypothetical protein R2781_03300 [Flavobacteriaceae bacterium]
MKTNASILGFVFFVSFVSLHAQENRTIKEETTVKKVITKEGSQVVVKEVKEVEKETGAVIVADDEKENQEFSEDTTKDTENKVIKNEATIDEQNEALIAAEKKRQEEALKASIEAEKAKAEAEKKILEEQKQARLKALEENRKKLEKRSKGIAPLKKNN